MPWSLRHSNIRRPEGTDSSAHSPACPAPSTATPPSPRGTPARRGRPQGHGGCRSTSPCSQQQPHDMQRDAEHPTDITMSRVRSVSDTCNIYFTYTKVNHLLYACPLDPFEDGILLDTPLVCIHRYCRNTMDEEECERKCTTTPSAREALKRRKKSSLPVQKHRYNRPCTAQLPVDRYNRPTTAQLPVDRYNRPTTAQLPVNLL